MSDPYRETQGYGAKIIFEPNVVPYCDKHPLEDDNNYEGLPGLPRPDPMQAERMGDRIEATDLRRMDNFLVGLFEDEGCAEELMDICVETALQFAHPQVESGAETIGIGDSAASQISPDVYEKLTLPRQQLLVKGLKEMGAKVRMHICGNITHLLPGLASLALDVLDVDHMVSRSRVREVCGRKSTICGNLDPVRDVLRGTPESIRAASEACYDEVGNPFMVNAGCEIPSRTPVENLQALCTPVAWKA